MAALKAAGIYGHFVLTLDGITAQRSTMPRNTTAQSLGGKQAAFVASLRSKAGTATKVSTQASIYIPESQVSSSSLLYNQYLATGWRKLEAASDKVGEVDCLPGKSREVSVTAKKFLKRKTIMSENKGHY